ncbi:ABC transporter permease [Dethiobacter alkaliphilus]|uniref:ABC-type Na+ efflux pump permease component-like protein n=1 Tax=Dethiobacter alkaliphilus AHT 1 TaxID=555088 RepID=C0GFH5_DETAL|nr:ABC transporter permease [Dethiobacter alkaliphilus]EEG77935.1 ABC-type Na+ efflux pump permease component-like protein [Dethiobacter alkaliphilus AHT 1]
MNNTRWSNIKRVARWEFIKALKSPTFLVLTFVVPLLMVAVGGISYLTQTIGSDQTVTVALVDETEDFYTFWQDQQHQSNLNLTLYPTSEQHLLEDLVLEGEYEGYMIFSEETLSTGHLPFYAEDIRSVNHDVIYRELESVISLHRMQRMGLAPEQIAAVGTPLRIDVRELSGEEINIAGLILPIISGVALIIATVFSGQVLMYGVIKEKQNRIVEILLSSISSFELMVGKILGFGLLSLTQMAIWATVGIIVAGSFFDVDILQFEAHQFVLPLLFFIFGYFMLASLFAAVGATMKEAEGSSQIHGLVIMIPMLPMFISGQLFMSPNALWVRILSHIPPFIPATVLLRMGATNLPVWEVASTLVALTISTIVITIFGARVFKGGIMQYDRAVNLRDLKAILAKDK